MFLIMSQFDTADGFTSLGFGGGGGPAFHKISHHLVNLTMPMVLPFSLLGPGGCPCLIRFLIIS